MIAHLAFGDHREFAPGRHLPRGRPIDFYLAQRSLIRPDVGNRDSRPAAAMGESEDEDSFGFRGLQMAVRRGGHGTGVFQARMRDDKCQRARQKAGAGPLQGIIEEPLQERLQIGGAPWIPRAGEWCRV